MAARGSVRQPGAYQCVIESLYEGNAAGVGPGTTTLPASQPKSGLIWAASSGVRIECELCRHAFQSLWTRLTKAAAGSS